MILKIDNQGAVDLANNSSAGRRTCHADVQQNFLRKLEENEILLVKWTPGPTNNADLNTKNLVAMDFK